MYDIHSSTCKTAIVWRSTKSRSVDERSNAWHTLSNHSITNTG